MPVVINEVHFSLPGQQYIELVNRAAFPVDVGGHHLSNDANLLNLFTIPSPTVISPGARLTFPTGTLRFAPGPLTSDEDLQQAVAAVSQVAKEVRR